MKISDPVKHAYFSEQIADIERQFDQGKITVAQCSDLVRYLRAEQMKLEVRQDA